MNANELADAMEIRASIRRQATSRKSVQEGANDRLADQLEQAATMLRQQQAEIEALKKEAALQRLSDFTQEAEKTLTDEEIDKLWHSDEFYEEWTDGSISAIHYNKFARAILRKAQEK